MRTAAATVHKACNIVPRNNHIRDLGPILSPIRPKKAPARNAEIDVRVSRSVSWKVVVDPGTSDAAKKRARASESYYCNNRIFSFGDTLGVV